MNKVLRCYASTVYRDVRKKALHVTTAYKYLLLCPSWLWDEMLLESPAYAATTNRALPALDVQIEE